MIRFDQGVSVFGRTVITIQPWQNIDEMKTEVRFQQNKKRDPQRNIQTIYNVNAPQFSLHA